MNVKLDGISIGKNISKSRKNNMDRICNNEGLVILSALYLLDNGVKELSRLDLLLVLSVDIAIRKRIVNYNNYQEFLNYEGKYDRTLNRKFKEFQLIILNALTLMKLSGMIEHGEGTELELSAEGKNMVEDATGMHEKSAIEVKNASFVLNSIAKSIDTIKLYNDLKIVL